MELTEKSQAWMDRCIREYGLKSGGETAVLEQAAHSLDRIDECRAAITRDGLFTQGQKGLISHPACRLELQHKAIVLQSCRALGITTPEA